MFDDKTHPINPHHAVAMSEARTHIAANLRQALKEFGVKVPDDAQFCDLLLAPDTSAADKARQRLGAILHASARRAGPCR